MSLNFEHDNIFDTENDDNPIFPFLSDNIIESEENLSDYTTGITGQMFQESLKKKRNREKYLTQKLIKKIKKYVKN